MVEIEEDGGAEEEEVVAGGSWGHCRLRPIPNLYSWSGVATRVVLSSLDPCQ